MRSPRRHGPIAIDAADLPLLLAHKWCRDQRAYLRRIVTVAERTREWVYLHRLIAGDKQGFLVDHISRDTMDNRRCNLRLATARQNTINAMKPNKIGLRGVFRSGCKYGAKIRLNVGRGPVHLGRFCTAEEAAKAYDVAARQHHGAFAVTNYPAADAGSR